MSPSFIECQNLKLKFVSIIHIFELPIFVRHKFPYQILQNEQSSSCFLHIHSQMVRNNIIFGSFKIKVTHIILGLFDSRNIIRIFKIIIWFSFIQFIPLKYKIESFKDIASNFFWGLILAYFSGLSKSVKINYWKYLLLCLNR